MSFLLNRSHSADAIVQPQNTSNDGIFVKALSSFPRGAYDHCQETDTVTGEVSNEQWRLRCRNSQIASSARPTRLTHSIAGGIQISPFSLLLSSPRSLTRILLVWCSKLEAPGNKSAQPDPRRSDFQFHYVFAREY